MWFTFLTDYKIGDHAGIIGVLVSVIGLWLTFKEAKASRSAAEAAQQAAIDAKAHALNFRSTVDTFGYIAQIVSELDEIKRLQQNAESPSDWRVIMQKYGDTAKKVPGIVYNNSIVMVECDFLEMRDSITNKLFELESAAGHIFHKNALPDYDQLQTKMFAPLNNLIVAIRKLESEAKHKGN